MQGVNKTRTKRNAGAALASLECQCGNPLPTRQHWMWECGPQPAGRHQPACYMERSLGVPLVSEPGPAPTATEHSHTQLQRAVVELLNRTPARSDGRILLATDGSAIGVQWRAAAACGFATTTATAEGPVWGADQTPGVAEILAVLVVLHAAATLGVSVHLLVDNLNVVRALQKILAGSQTLPPFGFGHWHSIRAHACPMVPPSRHLVSWVPSHGKKQSWRPPDPWSGQTSLWRELNDKADKAAERACQSQYHRRIRPSEPEVAAAHTWASELMKQLHESSTAYAMRFRDLYEADLGSVPAAYIQI